MSTIYKLLAIGNTIDNYLSEEKVPAKTKKKKKRPSPKIFSSNLVDEHKSYMEKLSLELMQTNLPEVSEESQFEECKQVKEARKISAEAKVVVDEALQYFQERKKFWDLFK